MSSFKLLSIDGGGIRGLLPALILVELERRLGKPMCELFDVIAGTSTGGILALGLSVAERPNASQLVELYKRDGATIFPRTIFDKAVGFAEKTLPIINRIRTIFDLPPDVEPRDAFDPKYDGEGRLKAMQAFFKNKTLSAARTRVFVASYDTAERKPVFFVRNVADIALPNAQSGSPTPNLYFYEPVGDGCSMVDAAMASSAAPTYFPPYELKRAEGGEPYSLVDGAVYANNPTGLAQAFLRNGRDYESDLVLSLGTGAMERPYPFKQIRGWGAAQWGVPALKMMIDGQTEAVALVMQKRLPPDQYFRFQPLLVPESGVSDDLDDVSPKNIESMEALAAKLIHEQSAQLDNLCAQLAQNRR